MISESNNRFNFQVDTTSQSSFSIGTKSFVHLDADAQTTHFKYDDKSYSLNLNEESRLDNFMTVNFTHYGEYLYVDYKTGDNETRKQVFYSITYNMSNFNYSMVDVQQKMIGGENINIKVCNDDNNEYSGGIVLSENFENGKKNSIEQLITIKSGCNLYTIPLLFQYLGRDDVNAFLYVVVSDSKISLDSNTITFSYCSTENGTTTSRTTDCLDNEITGYHTEKQVYFYKTSSTDYKLFSNIQAFYPYVVVDGIHNRSDINCRDKRCPEGFECLNSLYLGKTYYTCNKIFTTQKTIGDVVKVVNLNANTPLSEINEITATTENTQNKNNNLFIYISIIIIIMLLIIIGRMYLAKKNKK